MNSDMSSPTLAPYAATKAAVANLSASLAQLLDEREIRINSVAPGANPTRSLVTVIARIKGRA